MFLILHLFFDVPCNFDSCYSICPLQSFQFTFFMTENDKSKLKGIYFFIFNHYLMWLCENKIKNDLKINWVIVVDVDGQLYSFFSSYLLNNWTNTVLCGRDVCSRLKIEVFSPKRKKRLIIGKFVGQMILFEKSKV